MKLESLLAKHLIRAYIPYMQKSVYIAAEDGNKCELCLTRFLEDKLMNSCILGIISVTHCANNELILP